MVLANTTSKIFIKSKSGIRKLLSKTMAAKNDLQIAPSIDDDCFNGAKNDDVLVNNGRSTTHIKQDRPIVQLMQGRPTNGR